MLSIIIAYVVIFVLAFIVIYFDGNALMYSIIGSAFIAGLLSCIVMISLHAGSVTYISHYKEKFTFSSVKIYEKNIRTLTDNIGISGRFILGSGTIASGSKYYFYIIDSDSSYYLSSLSTDNCKIIESDTKTPCVVKYTRYIDWSKNEISDFLLKPKTESHYYHIYVPKNTVVINYTLDAK